MDIGRRDGALDHTAWSRILSTGYYLLYDYSAAEMARPAKNSISTAENAPH